jgi:hypothetical protein
MDHTIDLLNEALAADANQAEWARKLGLKRNAITTAKARQRLSPSIAGNLAHLLGKPTVEIQRWMAIAGLEAETQHPLARSKAMQHLRKKA